MLRNHIWEVTLQIVIAIKYCLTEEAENGTFPSTAPLCTCLCDNVCPRGQEEEPWGQKASSSVFSGKGWHQRGHLWQGIADTSHLPRQPLASGICWQSGIRKCSLQTTSRKVQLTVWGVSSSAPQSHHWSFLWPWAEIHPGCCPNSLCWVEEELIYISSRYARENSNWSKIKYS